MLFCSSLTKINHTSVKSWVVNRVFSHDVTAAILVSQNNETAAKLMSQTSPVGVELSSYANAFFCLDTGQVSENTLYFNLMIRLGKYN